MTGRDEPWINETTRAIARGIWDERAWERLPILADALEDGGFDCKEHLRNFRHGWIGPLFQSYDVFAGLMGWSARRAAVNRWKIFDEAFLKRDPMKYAALNLAAVTGAAGDGDA